MLLRTIEVPDASRQSLNAVALCCFTVSSIKKTFLAYSLNEKGSDDLVKIYLSSVEGDEKILSMYDAPHEILTTAVQVLKNIIRDACALPSRQSDSTYVLLDLTESEVRCTQVSSHYSLKISEQWLMSLLAYNPLTCPSAHSTAGGTPQNKDEYQPALPSPLNEIISETCKTSIIASYESVAPATPATRDHSDIKYESAHHIDEPSKSETIQENLKSLISSFANHKETLLGKYVKLDEQQTLLKHKEELLLAREMAVVKREEDLLISIEALKTAEKQLRSMIEY